jgi:hypothetical protein
MSAGVLVHRGVAEALNEAVRARGDKKTEVMTAIKAGWGELGRHCLCWFCCLPPSHHHSLLRPAPPRALPQDFKKGIYSLEWEHRRCDMQIGELVEKTRELQV